MGGRMDESSGGRSSVGQSGGLIIRWSQVRALPPPRKSNLGGPVGGFGETELRTTT
jgi:hypothetical protein